jgi:hypothetical protein
MNPKKIKPRNWMSNEKYQEHQLLSNVFVYEEIRAKLWGINTSGIERQWGHLIHSGLTFHRDGWLPRDSLQREREGRCAI